MANLLASGAYWRCDGDCQERAGHARKQTVWQGRHRGCALSEEDSHPLSETQRGWAGSPTQDLFKNLSQHHPHRTVGEQNVFKGRCGQPNSMQILSARKFFWRLPWCTCVSASARQSRAQCCGTEFAGKILLAALKRKRDLWRASLVSPRAASASLHALLVRSVRRSALGHHRSTLRSPPAAQSPTRPPDGRR